jgi:hypothetical protein
MCTASAFGGWQVHAAGFSKRWLLACVAVVVLAGYAAALHQAKADVAAARADIENAQAALALTD